MKIRLLLLSALSGILICLALPNEIHTGGIWILGFFCLTPLFISLYWCRDKRFAHLIGIVYGLVSSVCCYYWLMYFGEFSLWTITGVSLGYAVFCFFLAPFLQRLIQLPRIYRPFILAAAWTLYEYFKSSGYLAFPWGLSAYPLADFLPLIQIVDITGIWGLSFLMACANTLIMEGILLITESPGNTNRNPIFFRQVIFWGSCMLISLLYGLFRMNQDIPIKKSFTAVIVQANIDPWVGTNEIPSLITAQNLSKEGIAELGEVPNVITWNESSFRRPYVEYRDFFEKYPEGDSFVSFMKESGSFLLAGSPYVLDWDKREMLNAVLLINSEGTVQDFYGKQHPVPLAEHVPFWELKIVQRFYKNEIGLPNGGWVLGTESKIFTIPLKDGGTLDFGVPICFEDAFPPLCRQFFRKGAEVLINLSNDSWSQTVSAEIQHFVVAKFRAVESKRVLVRSTNGGVTAVIGPFGEILDTLPLFTESYIATSIPVYAEDSPTFYMLFGDYLPFLFLGLILTTLVIQARGKKRTSKNCSF